MKYIELSQNKKAIIDDIDYKKVNKYRWYFSQNGYAKAFINKKDTFLHRFILQTPKGMDTDHINGNRLDNRRENLRICTRSQNQANKIIKEGIKYSFYKGVSWHKNRKFFQSYIKINKKQIFIGYFKNELHAAVAYDLWAKELFGDFAKLNFKSI